MMESAFKQAITDP